MADRNFASMTPATEVHVNAEGGNYFIESTALSFVGEVDAVSAFNSDRVDDFACVFSLNFCAMNSMSLLAYNMALERLQLSLPIAKDHLGSLLNLSSREITT